MKKTISLNLGPTYYGENNLYHCIAKKVLAFELEIKDESTMQRHLLTLGEVVRLKKQIEDAMVAYRQFVNSDEKTNENH